MSENETPVADKKVVQSITSLSKGNGSETIRYIPLSSIQVDPEYNVRDFSPSSNDRDMECHQKTLNRLTLAEEGQIEAKKVIEHALYVETKDPEGNPLETPRLAQGHRRYSSLALAVEQGEHEEILGEDPLVPVLVVQFASETDRQLDLIESNKHAELTMAQAGEVFSRLVALGHSTEEIAERTGYKQAHIYNCLKFYGMSPKIKKLVEKGVISTTMVIDITRNAAKLAKQQKLEEGFKGKDAVPTDKEISKVEVAIVEAAVEAAQARAEEAGLDKKFARVVKADALPPREEEEEEDDEQETFDFDEQEEEAEEEHDEEQEEPTSKPSKAKALPVITQDEYEDLLGAVAEVLPQNNKARTAIEKAISDAVDIIE